MSDIVVRTPMQEVIAAVRSDQFLTQVQNALPGNVTPERFVRCAVTAIQQTPALILADRDSLFQSIVRCAQVGLLPDGREAAFVEVKIKGEKKVQFWPMVGGFRKIAAKHGFTLVADVVRDGDTFSWSRVPPKLEHTPKIGTVRGEITAAYAVAFDRDWRFVTSPIVMDVAEIEKIRKVSRAATNEYGPWVNWWDRMACKTVTRRLFNELPLGDLDEVSARIREAADDEADLEQPPAMTTDEANVAARLGPLVPPVSEPPEDHAADEADWSEVEPGEAEVEVEPGSYSDLIPESARQA